MYITVWIRSWFQRLHFLRSLTHTFDKTPSISRRMPRMSILNCCISAQLSVIAEGPRDALCHLKSCQLRNNSTKNCIWKGLQGHSLKVIRHRQWRDAMHAMRHFLVVGCNNVYLASFRFETYNARVRLCHEKSFSLETTAELQATYAFHWRQVSPWRRNIQQMP